MKATTLTCGLASLFMTATAQFPVTTASDNTGILTGIAVNNDIINVNYERSSSSLGLSYKHSRQAPQRNFVVQKNTPTRQLPLKDYSAFNVNLSFDITDDKLPLYSEGKYAGGYNLSFIYSRTHTNIKYGAPTVILYPDGTKDTETKAERYEWLSYYFGGVYKTSKNNFFEVQSGDSSILIESKLSHDIRFVIGGNYGVKTKHALVIMGLSCMPRYVAGSSLFKEDDEEQLNMSNGKTYVDGEGKTVSVQSEKKAFRGKSFEGFLANPRFDINVIFFTGKESNYDWTPKIGLYGSINTAFSSFSSPKYSLSIGPTFHLAKSVDQVVFGIYSDFNNIERYKKIKEVFSLNFYAGIPINLN